MNTSSEPPDRINLQTNPRKFESDYDFTTQTFRRGTFIQRENFSSEVQFNIRVGWIIAAGFTLYSLLGGNYFLFYFIVPAILYLGTLTFQELRGPTEDDYGREADAIDRWTHDIILAFDVSPMVAHRALWAFYLGGAIDLDLSKSQFYVYRLDLIKDWRINAAALCGPLTFIFKFTEHDFQNALSKCGSKTLDQNNSP